MVSSRPIHEVKDQLSRIIAEVEATGDEVQITRHGQVVAVLGPARAGGVVLGAGEREGVRAPSLEELAWDTGEVDEFLDATVEPR